MSNRLPLLLDNARAAHLAVERARRTAAHRALEAGAALCEAKDLVRHGEWADRLAETGIPERTAQRYMAIHRGGCESAIVADLGIVECARLSGVGLRAWPGKTEARQACNECPGYSTLAIWYHEADNSILFGLARLHPDEPARDWAGYRPFTKPWLLGYITEQWLAHGTEFSAISLDEAVVTLAEWSAA